MKWILWLLGSVVLGSCSLKPITPNVRVKVGVEGNRFRESISESDRGGGSAFKPSTAASFQCYFVSIKGEEISSRFTTLALSGLNPACDELQLGATSNLVTSAGLLAGVSLSVPAGNNRTIRVFGVNSNTGTDCAGKTLKDVFDATHWGSIFEVGNVTQNLLVGQDVTILPTFVTTNFDLAATCSKRAVLPLAGVYHLKVIGAITSVQSLPPSHIGTAYTRLAVGSNVSFPISLTTSTGQESIHFIFAPPQGRSKPTSNYSRVLFISNSVSSGTSIKSDSSCGSGVIKNPNPALALSTYNALASGRNVTLAADSFAFPGLVKNSDAELTLDETMVINQVDVTDPNFLISLGSYVNLSLYSANTASDVAGCSALVVDDMMALAVEP